MNLLHAFLIFNGIANVYDLLLVPNGPKDHHNEREDLDSWRSHQQHHQVCHITENL